MSAALRIAIVGSGTAGPAAAIFLARAGHEVILFEKAPQKLPVGAGFLLQPTGLSVLAQLGLPIIAETTSNLWGRPALAPLLLPSAEATFRAMDIRQVIRIGGVPSARWWRDLENRPQVWITNITRLPFSGLADCPCRRISG